MRGAWVNWSSLMPWIALAPSETRQVGLTRVSSSTLPSMSTQAISMTSSVLSSPVVSVSKITGNYAVMSRAARIDLVLFSAA